MANLRHRQHLSMIRRLFWYFSSALESTGNTSEITFRHGWTALAFSISGLVCLKMALSLSSQRTGSFWEPFCIFTSFCGKQKLISKSKLKTANYYFNEVAKWFNLALANVPERWVKLLWRQASYDNGHALQEAIGCLVWDLESGHRPDNLQQTVQVHPHVISAGTADALKGVSGHRTEKRVLQTHQQEVKHGLCEKQIFAFLDRVK